MLRSQNCKWSDGRHRHLFLVGFDLTSIWTRGAAHSDLILNQKNYIDSHINGQLLNGNILQYR